MQEQLRARAAGNMNYGTDRQRAEGIVHVLCIPLSVCTVQPQDGAPSVADYALPVVTRVCKYVRRKTRERGAGMPDARRRSAEPGRWRRSQERGPGPTATRATATLNHALNITHQSSRGRAREPG